MKAKPKKQNTQTQTPKPQVLDPVVQDSDVITQRRNSQIRKLQEPKPRRTKGETPLGQFRPQRVSKAR